MTTTAEPSLSFPSLKAAASASGIPYAALQAMKAEGLPGFETSGRVHLPQVLAAMFSRSDAGEIAPPPGMRNWREALNKAQAERQQLKLEQERGRLVERAFVATAIQLAAGELNALRARWEAEMPVQFAATNGDIPECRTILRGIFDEVFRGVQSLGKHFRDS